jgi:hypothetical protein
LRLVVYFPATSADQHQPAAAWHRFSRGNFSFVDRQPQTAAEDLGMTSLLEAQTKRIQELDELVVTLQKIKGGLLAELNDQRANMNKLQAENKRFREREQEELWELVEMDENYVPPQMVENGRHKHQTSQMDWLVGREETVAARQQAAGCEPAASLQAAESLRAARREAAASLPRRMMPTGLAPWEYRLLLKTDAEERLRECLRTHGECLGQCLGVWGDAEQRLGHCLGIMRGDNIGWYQMDRMGAAAALQQQCLVMLQQWAWGLPQLQQQQQQATDMYTMYGSTAGLPGTTSCTHFYVFTRTKYKYQRLRRSVAGDPNLHLLAANPYAQMAQQQPTMATLATHVAHLDLGAEVKR